MNMYIRKETAFKRITKWSDTFWEEKNMGVTPERMTPKVKKSKYKYIRKETVNRYPQMGVTPRTVSEEKNMDVTLEGGDTKRTL